MVGEAGKVAGSVIEPLRWTPLLLALVIFDVIYLILGFTGRSTSANAATRSHRRDSRVHGGSRAKRCRTRCWIGESYRPTI
jgi:hypothetical protein